MVAHAVHWVPETDVSFCSATFYSALFCFQELIISSDVVEIARLNVRPSRSTHARYLSCFGADCSCFPLLV